MPKKQTPVRLAELAEDAIVVDRRGKVVKAKDKRR